MERGQLMPKLVTWILFAALAVLLLVIVMRFYRP